jgi:hypothetical protein
MTIPENPNHLQPSRHAHVRRQAATDDTPETAVPQRRAAVDKPGQPIPLPPTSMLDRRGPVVATLSPEHETTLRLGSGIDPLVIAERGYRTVTDRQDLLKLGFTRNQALVPGLLISLHDVTGQVAGYQFRPDTPRLRKDKPVKYETPTGARNIVDVPPRAQAALGDPAIPLVVTEGAKKADSAVSHGLCCVALAGVWGWRGTNDAGGKTALPGWDTIAVNGRDVFIAFDSDIIEKPEVGLACRRFRDFLQSRGALVHVLQLPPGPGGTKVGLDDFFAQGHTSADMYALPEADVATAVELSVTPEDARAWLAAHPAIGRLPSPAIIDVDQDFPLLIAAAWKTILEKNEPPVIYRSGGTPVRLEDDDHDHPILHTLTGGRLRHRLARVAIWEKLDYLTGERKSVAPPTVVVSDMLNQHDQPWPILHRLVEAPVFAADGTLQTVPGYSPASRTLYVPTEPLDIPPVPTQPTPADVQRARSLLCDDLLGDFPFVGDAERAHAITAALLPFARDLIAGPTPLHLIEAPKEGTGKTLLVDALLWAAQGHTTARQSEAKDEDEWRKRITATLIGSPAVILLDNLKARLDSASLASVLTSTSGEDRRLGHTEMVGYTNRATWLATANNPRLSGEMVRRTVRIRLDARVEHPSRRALESFAQPDLLGWTHEHRGVLIWASCVLIQSWLAAGRPRRPAGARNKGMFEAWAATMGGILHVATIPGFLGNEEDFSETADSEIEGVEELIALWATSFGRREVGVRDLYMRVKEADCLDLGDGTERSQRTVLGRRINDMRDRLIGGYRIVKVRERSSVLRWRLDPVRTAVTGI